MAREANRIDVFVSYSRAADSRLAPAIQRGLSRLAKKWWRIRALTVFRDETDLSASDALGGSIESALDEARFFVLLASPAAAASKWVRKEIEHWQRTKGSATFLIALTDGHIRWDDEAGDFDWDVTDALPRSLSGYFRTEPLWQDFTWSRDAPHLSLRHSEFRAAIATMAAPVHGRSKRELDNEDVEAHRRLRAIGIAVVLALISLMASAGIEYLQADAQKNRALADLKDATALGTVTQAHDRLSDSYTGDDVGAYQFLLAGQLLAHSSAAQGSVYNAELNAVYAHPNLLGVVTPAEQVADGLTTLTADGTRAVSSDAHGDVHVWSTRTGLATGHALQPSAAGGAALALAFSPDGRRAAAAYPSRVVVWDTGTGSRIADIAKPDNAVTAGIALSPDGNTVGVDGGDLRLWDVRTGKPIGAPVPGEGGHVAFSPDGRQVAFDEIFSSSTTVHVRRLASGGTRDAGEVRFTVPNAMSTCMTFSPDGKQLAVGAADGTLRLWHAGTGTPAGPRMTGHAGAVDDVAFSPDGTRLVTAGQDRTLREWNTATGTPVGYPLTGPNQAANYVRFTPDGKELLSLSADRTVRRWDAMTGTAPLALGLPNAPGQTAVAPKGTTVAVAVRDGVQVWNYATGRRVATLPVPAGVASMSYSSDGRSLLMVTVLEGHALLWDGDTVRPVKLDPSIGTLTTATFMPPGLPFMPTGREIAVGTSSGKVVLEDVDANLSGTPGATIAAGCPVQHIAVSDDGMRIAFSCLNSHKLGVADGIAKSLHVDTSTDTVEAMAFSPDGSTLVIGTADGLVWRRDVAKRTTTSVGVHRGPVTSVAYSPDGRFFASAGADGSVVLYPATSTLISTRLTASSGSVATAAFTSDSGHLLAFATTEPAARIWHVFPDPTAELCARVPSPLSPSDWNKWVSSVLAYQTPCTPKSPSPAG